MDRNTRNLEIVRQTAEILSSGSSLAETFERFCLMLAEFTDAAVVFIAIKHADGAYFDFYFDHGETAHPHRPINPQSQTQRVLETGQPIFIRTLAELHGPVIPLKKDDDSKSAMFVPLRFGAETIGVLSVQTQGEHAYTREDLHLLETCALYVAVSVQAEQVRSEKERLQSVASRDALTGVASRRTFDQRLHDDWTLAQREDGVLSVLVMDVDWFKRFNDTYGHVAGDACLKQVAQAAQSCIVRECDLFARYGGEEFAAILWSTEAAGAAVVAERILNAIRALDIPHAESPLGRVTTSIGIAGTRALSIADPQTLVKAADRALYAAKTAGRDRIHVDAFGSNAAAPRQRVSHTNIRTQSTPLLGRSTEIAALTEALKRSNVVSVTGARGLGKTRIAVAAAQRRIYAYPDGTWLIDCSIVSDGSLLETAVLGTLGIAQGQDVAPREALLAELSRRNLLLIFDNCERLRDCVRDLCEAIAFHAPHVTMVATAAGPLEAAGEETYELHPPNPVDAVSLFIDRAQAVAPGFDPSEEERDLIEHVCAALSNVPLAIELTASRIAKVSLGEIARSLDETLEPTTVATAIDWSYRLLSENASRLFERLSVFPALFKPDSARDICSGGDLEPWDVPDALDELTAANLAKKFDGHESPRYLIVEQAREFGREALRERLERTAIQWRYIRYFRAVARRYGSRLESGHVEGNLDELLSELENVHGALEYALHRRVDVTAGADIVVAMRRFWSETGRLSEGRYWTEMALSCGLPEGALRAEVLYAAALIAHYTGDMVRLNDLSAELVAYHEAGKDPHALAKALNGLANARFRLGDVENAKAIYDRALEYYKQAENRRGMAIVLLNLGSLSAESDCDLRVARERFLESLSIFRELGVSINTGSVLSNLAGVTNRDGRHREALAYANEALVIFQRLGNHAYAAAQLMHVAHARIALGEIALARDALVAAHEHLRREPTIRYVAEFFEVGFVYAFETGMYDLAARVLGFLERIRTEQRIPRTAASVAELAPREKELALRLGNAFDTYRDQGRAGELSAMERDLDLALEKVG